MRLSILAAAVALMPAVCAQDTMLQDFDDLSPRQLADLCVVKSDGLSVGLIKTDERAGKQNLQITAQVDPAHPEWKCARLRFARRVAAPQTLTFWLRGDKAAGLYIIVEDSHGTRTDVTVGSGLEPGKWHLASIPLADMHVPNGEPPNDKATPADVAALEFYAHAATYPEAGQYRFQIDDISVSSAKGTEVEQKPIDAVAAPLSNGGFEQLQTDADAPDDWGLSISRDAKVTLRMSQDARHSGERSALFHNESPVSPHVYGRFLQRVPVQPSTPYRLSCWVKGDGVRGGNHWTDWKSYSLSVPSGTYDWREIVAEFVTDPGQTTLEVGLNVVNVTDSLWVDDVSVTTDLTVAPAKGGQGKVAIWCPRSAASGGEPVSVKVLWQDLPQAAGELRIEILQGDDVLAAASEDWKTASGKADYALSVPANERRDHRARLTVTSVDGELLASCERPIDIVSNLLAEKALEGVTAKLEALNGYIDDWQNKGLPTDYPTVTRTVIESFIPWVQEDINRSEIERALQQIDEMGEILDAALAQCQNPPVQAALTVPRYRTSDIEIDGGHFVADVQWPDGKRERRPVFFCGYGHFNSVKRDIEKFPAYGLNAFQVEFGPRGTVNEDLSINYGAYEHFEGVLRRAEEADVAVNLLLSPHYFPGWALEKWPQLGGVNGGFIQYDIDAPESREIEKAFLQAVVARLKARPGLHSLCLSNEPIYVSAPDSPSNLAGWHTWLTERYGQIERLNEVWGDDFASFGEVPIQVHDDLSPRPALYDWVSFNNQRFAGWHRWMADIIHDIDPEMPVHAKIMDLPFQRHTVTWGNDVELFCDLSQIAGNDCSNNYVHDDGSEWANGWQSEYMYYDLLRSMKNQPVFNSENHVVTDRNWRPVPGAHMRNLIWQGAIHGMGASTMWVWERTYDPQSSFAGSVMHRPAFCDAHGRAALDLMRLAPQVAAIQDQPARVAVVYSIASQVWNTDYSRHAATVYQALTFLGEKIDFVTANQLAAGAGDRYSVIIAPGVTHFEDAGYKALADFAAEPGHELITVGEGCLTHDEYGRDRDTSALPARGLALLSAQELRDELRQAVELDFPVTVADDATGSLAWGVGWRWAQADGGLLVNLCNYTRKPVTVTVALADEASLTNLMTGGPITGAIHLEPMEPLLLSATRRN